MSYANLVALSASEYGELAWLYLDPASLKDENVRLFLRQVLEQGAGHAYEGQIVFFSEIKRKLEKAP